MGEIGETEREQICGGIQRETNDNERNENKIERYTDRQTDREERGREKEREQRQS